MAATLEILYMFVHVSPIIQPDIFGNFGILTSVKNKILWLWKKKGSFMVMGAGGVDVSTIKNNKIKCVFSLKCFVMWIITILISSLRSSSPGPGKWYRVLVRPAWPPHLIILLHRLHQSGVWSWRLSYYWDLLVSNVDILQPSFK